MRQESWSPIAGVRPKRHNEGDWLVEKRHRRQWGRHLLACAVAWYAPGVFLVTGLFNAAPLIRAGPDWAYLPDYAAMATMPLLAPVVLLFFGVEIPWAAGLPLAVPVLLLPALMMSRLQDLSHRLGVLACVFAVSCAQWALALKVSELITRVSRS